MAASGIVTLDTFLGYRKITSIKLQQNIQMLRKAIIKLSVVKAHLEFTKLDITAGDNTADHIEIISLSTPCVSYGCHRRITCVCIFNDKLD